MIRIIGPREVRSLDKGVPCVNTTSKAGWSSGLSPFTLGPCNLYSGRSARLMENAWQFAKVYPDQLGADGEPAADYWRWAERGWDSRTPVRYPMGKGAKPAYCFWGGEHLGYIDARLQVYFPLYRDAVAANPAFGRLQAIAAQHQDVALFDFDGYDHEAAGMSLADVLRYERRPMGHAFVLKAMLELGADVTPERIFKAGGTARLQQRPRQPSLF